MTTLPAEDDGNGNDDDKATVLCDDCGVIASSAEEARGNGLCHAKVFDARRLVVVGGDDEDQEEKAAAGRLENDDGYYYWLCPDCFHHMREALPVVGGDFDKFSHRC